MVEVLNLENLLEKEEIKYLFNYIIHQEYIIKILKLLMEIIYFFID